MSYKDDITPGMWFEENGRVYHENGVACIAVTDNTELYESIANMKLTAEAGTVTNETGKTPRELQKERDEALAALRDIKKIEDEYDKYYMKQTDPADQEVLRITTETIDKIEGGGDDT